MHLSSFKEYSTSVCIFFTKMKLYIVGTYLGSHQLIYALDDEILWKPFPHWAWKCLQDPYGGRQNEHEIILFGPSWTHHTFQMTKSDEMNSLYKQFLKSDFWQLTSTHVSIWAFEKKCTEQCDF